MLDDIGYKSRVPDQVTDPYFHRTVRIGGDGYNLFHPITTRLELTITRNDIHRYIICQYNPTDGIVHLERSPNTTGVLDMIRRSLAERVNSVGYPYPAHLVLYRGNFYTTNSEHMRKSLPAGKKGKKAVPEHEGSVIWEGPCMHMPGKKTKANAKEMWENPSERDKCSTWYKVVLPESEVIKLATATSNVDLKCFLTCQGRCCHKKGVEKGRLSGSDRKRARKEVE